MSRRRDVEAQGLDALAEVVARAPDGRVGVFAAAALVGSSGRAAMLTLDEIVAAWNAKHPGDRLTLARVKTILESAHDKIRHALRGFV